MSPAAKVVIGGWLGSCGSLSYVKVPCALYEIVIGDAMG